MTLTIQERLRLRGQAEDHELAKQWGTSMPEPVSEVPVGGGGGGFWRGLGGVLEGGGELLLSLPGFIMINPIMNPTYESPTPSGQVNA